MADKSKYTNGFEEKVLSLLADFSKRFDKQDARFDRIDKQLKKQDDYMEYHFMAIQEQFLDFEKRMDEIKKALNDIDNWQDAISKRLEISEEEKMMMGRQLSRQDVWCHELADSIGYKLSNQI